MRGSYGKRPNLPPSPVRTGKKEKHSAVPALSVDEQNAAVVPKEAVSIN